jgi:hypothetical protein
VYVSSLVPVCLFPGRRGTLDLAGPAWRRKGSHVRSEEVHTHQRRRYHPQVHHHAFPSIRLVVLNRAALIERAAEDHLHCIRHYRAEASSALDEGVKAFSRTGRSPCPPPPPPRARGPQPPPPRGPRRHRPPPEPQGHRRRLRHLNVTGISQSIAHVLWGFTEVDLELGTGLRVYARIARTLALCCARLKQQSVR